MKCLAAFSLTLGLLFPSSVSAASVRTIFAAQAQGNGSAVTLEVSPGMGLNINFIPLGEIVKKAWIDDPSRIVLSFDGSLCQSGSDNNQQECLHQGATVIHLRQIKPINFTALPRSASGTTLLTLVTEGAEGRKLYQFMVRPTANEPKYTTLTVVPDPEKLVPVIELPTTVSSNTQWQSQTTAPISQSSPTNANIQPSTAQPVQSIPAHFPQPQFNTVNSPSPTEASKPSAITSTQKQPSTLLSSPAFASTRQPKVTNSPSLTQAKVANSSFHPAQVETRQGLVATSKQVTQEANAFRTGLRVAVSKKQINYGTTNYKKAQSAILLLFRGMSREETAEKSGLPIQVLTQLIKWGSGKPSKTW